MLVRQYKYIRADSRRLIDLQLETQEKIYEHNVKEYILYIRFT